MYSPAPTPPRRATTLGRLADDRWAQRANHILFGNRLAPVATRGHMKRAQGSDDRRQLGIMKRRMQNRRPAPLALISLQAAVK